MNDSDDRLLKTGDDCASVSPHRCETEAAAKAARDHHHWTGQWN